MAIQHFIQYVVPENKVVLSLDQLKKLKEIIAEVEDGIGDLPMACHYFHIGETNNKLILAGFDKK